ncbi:hypothetical protein MLD38_007715 [Melastoma candidum]|uniref:Uncharacterized protein n=1 Tax=Melastoma candidum TaxID=119954 RepID=A0ACB9RRL8_9MYRT|nr:hypothetical protein MLD38_007715 [Melastoma candidum]
MAVVLLSPSSSLLRPKFLPRLSAPSSPPTSRRRPSLKPRSAHTPMEAQSEFTSFPHASPPVRSLMSDLVSAVEQRLGDQLQACTLPPDVRSYRNDSGAASGSLHIRCGKDSSKVDFILGSWLHCQLPNGAALNITSLSGYLCSSTDAPNFLLELIQSSPTSLVLILDLPPRVELVTHPEYLSTFYEDTELDSWRQALEKVPEARPYFSSALYIRCVVSPTAIMLRIETEPGLIERMEEIVRDHVSPVAKGVLGLWLEQCVSGERVLSETERAALEKRDGITRRKTIEIDLASNFPRLFGPEIAERVVGILREVFGV